MAIIATGSKTIIDLSDGKSLSVYLGANQPRTQINDVNANTYSPDWTTTAGKLTITPVVYANQTAIALNNTALTITWKRKDGSAAEAALISGETVSGKALTVNKNNLATATSKQLTYIAYVAYADPDTGLTINAMADITFALLTTGEDAKSAWISGEQVFKNTVGQTCLICRLWQNGVEVDPLKSTTYSKTAPSSPSTGDFYYQIQNSGAATKLMRYSGSAWADVTTDATYAHEKTYTWYRRDKDGNPMDSGAAFATGKVIYVDGDDVTVKTVFVCEVE